MEGDVNTGLGKCTGQATTHLCCGSSEACRSNFVCVGPEATKQKDECGGICVDGAKCQYDAAKKAYGCVCSKGQFGNGRHCSRGEKPPLATFDKDGKLQGKMLAEDYCGCQAKKIDYCIGVECMEHASCVNEDQGHKCVCEDGYDMEGDQCVDKKNAVRLHLQGPEVVKKQQGDPFEDPLVR